MSNGDVGIVKAWEERVRKSQAAAGGGSKKRGSSRFFARMSVAHADDAEEEGSGVSGGDFTTTTKVLSNGDMYSGQWVDNAPHGQGKYLWTDGCMYSGEWNRGKAMGKGRFSWPSGATYEGEFKSGYMDGEGTYTGSGCVTYKGSWVMNLKHGKGTKSYSNGDYYAGEWRKGLQEGQGRYQWRNGNYYIGQWKDGKMNGVGTMNWSNGNRYDGNWEGGLPKGNGTFRWADGSFYVGVWSKDPKEQSGTYYPLGSGVGNLDWDPQEVFLVELNDCKVCQCEMVSVLPSQKVLGLPGLEGEILLQKQQPLRRLSKSNDVRLTRISVDERLSDGGLYGWGLDADISRDILDAYSAAGREREQGLGSLQIDDLDSSRGARPSQQIRLPPVRRQGETISKGHKNYELMLNLQLGIRC